MSDKQLRPDQMPPSWKIWGMSAGRGTGKTLAAVNWINQFASSTMRQRILIMVPGEGDISTMAETFTSDSPDVVWKPSIRRLTWGNTDSIAFIAHSEEPYALRGMQAHLTFMDDVQRFALDGPDDYDGGISRITTMDAVKFVTRLGTNPQFIVTHTPDYEKFEGATYTMDQ